jgi:hypothetical protein
MNTLVALGLLGKFGHVDGLFSGAHGENSDVF